MITHLKLFSIVVSILGMTALSTGCTTQHDVQRQISKARELRQQAHDLSMLPAEEHTGEVIEDLNLRADEALLHSYYARKQRSLLSFVWFETLEHMVQKLPFVRSDSDDSYLENREEMINERQGRGADR